MANLALKYRPQTFDDITEQSIVVDMLKNICKSDELENRNFLLIGPAGTGKAQPMYSKILTPNGFINMGDVHIGQEVFTANGNIGKVIGIYPQGVRPIYEITLQDRTKIRVSDEHLNVCYRYNQDLKRREDFCMTTTELVGFNKSSRFKLRVDIPKVTWQSDVTPIDPYLLGALLGDGSLSSGNFGFSNSEPDVVDKVDKILRRDWNKYLKKCNGDNVDYDIANVHQAYHKYTIEYQGNSFTSLSDVADALSLAGYPKFDSSTILRLCEGTATNTLKQYPELAKELTCSIDPNYRNWQEIDPLRAALAELKLTAKSTEKHIPAEYLYATEDIRLELLRGLYDTDGYTDVHGVTSYTTCSDQLSEDFAFLVRSLGIRDTIVDAPSYYTHDGIRHCTGTVAHTHNLKIPNDMLYCSSAKHLNRRKHRQHEPMRNIIDIKYIGDEECQCIMIDHPDHTYISDDFVPTHNTTSARIMANMLNNNVGEPIEVDAASHSGVDSIREIIQQAKAYPVGCKYKVFIIDEVHSLSQTAFQALLKAFEDGVGRSIFILCTTNPEKIPATIISRVQVFQLSKISLDGIISRLKYVLDSEIKEGRHITYTDDAVSFIAKLANGGMRDSLTLLDKALTYSTDLTTENLVCALNLPNYDDYFKLLGACAKKDNTAITAIINSVYNSGVNFVKWFEGFHGFVMNVVKYIFLQDINETTIPAHYKDKISKYTTAHAAVCLKLANKLLQLNYELKSTQYLQEVALTHLCTIPKKEGH